MKIAQSTSSPAIDRLVDIIVTQVTRSLQKSLGSTVASDGYSTQSSSRAAEQATGLDLADASSGSADTQDWTKILESLFFGDATDTGGKPSAKIDPGQNSSSYDAAGQEGLRVNGSHAPIKAFGDGSTVSGGKLAAYSGLGQNKKQIYQACQNLKASPDETALIMSVGMIESTHMTAAQRDGSKDSDAAAKNVSCFNMNMDMLRKVGYTGDGSDLNNNPAAATKWMLKAIRTLTPQGFIDFHRGGSTGYCDGKSYDCRGYQIAANTMMKYLRQDPSLMTNDQRPEFNWPTQGM